MIAFGLRLEPEFRLPGAWTPAPAGREPPLRMRLASAEEVAAAFSGGSDTWWDGGTDGRRHQARIGAGGDVGFLLDGRPAFHLDADHELLLCALRPDDWTAWRVLMDSVLFTVSLLRGYELLHCGAVQTPAGTVAIVAATGGGKSTLTCELVHHGAGLVTDDLLALEARGDGVTAHCGPPLLTRHHDYAHPVGEPISDLGEETWCAHPVAVGPAPLAAVVLLERAGSGEPVLTPVAPSPLVVLHHLLGFSTNRERVLRRIELAAGIARSASLFTLTAGMQCPPERLASLVREITPSSTAPKGTRRRNIGSCL